jgi:hypothetical protein
MIAVWSLWSKPLNAFPSSAWRREKDHLLSWILSVETAKRHYDETRLVTDTEGARLLVDSLGLEFSKVEVVLDFLNGTNPEWWALGKLYAYLNQDRPFVHIDSDVYLWNPLPPRVANAPVLAQNPEHFDVGTSWYRIDYFDRILQAGGWLPNELRWFKSHSPHQKAECCGIFGGNTIDFIHYYADNAIKLVEHPVNAGVWSQIGGNNILVEQYFLSACIEYHRQSVNQENGYGGIGIEYLFQSAHDAFNPAIAEQVGYTHLIGGAKRNELLMQRLEKRVQRDYAAYFENCERYFRNH